MWKYPTNMYLTWVQYWFILVCCLWELWSPDCCFKIWQCCLHAIAQYLFAACLAIRCVNPILLNRNAANSCCLMFYQLQVVNMIMRWTNISVFFYNYVCCLQVLGNDICLFQKCSAVIILCCVIMPQVIIYMVSCLVLFYLYTFSLNSQV